MISQQIHIDTITDHLYKLIQESSNSQAIYLVQNINKKLAELNSLLQIEKVKTEKEMTLVKAGISANVSNNFTEETGKAGENYDNPKHSSANPSYHKKDQLVRVVKL